MSLGQGNLGGAEEPGAGPFMINIHQHGCRKFQPKYVRHISRPLTAVLILTWKRLQTLMLPEWLRLPPAKKAVVGRDLIPNVFLVGGRDWFQLLASMTDLPAALAAEAFGGWF